VSSHAGDPTTRRRICAAALRLILRRRGAVVALADVAQEARVSRQALYLHFANRADLLVAVVRYADDRRGLAGAVSGIDRAPTGVAALRALAAMQARMNPDIWPLARVLEAMRHQDKAAERSWRDRLESRREGCRAIVARLRREGTLLPGLTPEVAADILWTLTSLQTWEDLVLLRGWSADEYEARMTALLTRALIAPASRPGALRATRAGASRSSAYTSRSTHPSSR
jgi:AcrR family transcriptional regulator